MLVLVVIVLVSFNNCVVLYLISTGCVVSGEPVVTMSLFSTVVVGMSCCGVTVVVVVDKLVPFTVVVSFGGTVAAVMVVVDEELVVVTSWVKTVCD